MILSYQIMDSMVFKTYTTEQTAWIVTAKSRQLAYWDSTRILRPSLQKASGQGTRRLYSYNDLIQLKIIIALLDRGLSLQRIRRGLNYISTLKFPLSELRIMTDGKSIYFSKEEGILVDTLEGGQMISQVIVGDLIKEVHEQVTRMVF
jgi:DNA-binding transcriptional MerR regulator